MILEVQNLKKYFPVKSGFFSRTSDWVKAVNGVSLQLEKGKTLGIVGESGCGKSTLARVISQIYEPTEGEVLFEGKNIFKPASHLEKKELRKKIQMIFQNPAAALNPRMTIGHILEEPLKIHKIGTRKERRNHVVELLELVGLDSHCLNRYPHEFSGGQKQRVGIARAISLKPEVIICDEPVSALDVSIQAQILNLLKNLQSTLNLSLVFISHDLSVVRHVCDNIAVMYLGKIVELASSESFYQEPLHPYSQALIKAIPLIGKGKVLNRQLLKGDVPSPIHLPLGCAFQTRCPEKIKECEIHVPPLEESKNQHHTACWLKQKGVLS